MHLVRSLALGVVAVAAGCQFDSSPATREPLNPLNTGSTSSEHDSTGMDPSGATGQTSFDSMSDAGTEGSTGSSEQPFELPTFGDAQPIEVLSQPGQTDDHPSLTEDLTELYFSSTRNSGNQMMYSGSNIWRSVRNNANANWSPPELVEALSSPDQDKAPDISADGLTMLLSRQSTGMEMERDRFDLYLSTRADRASAWSTPQRLTELAQTDFHSSAAFPLDPDTGYICYSDGTPDTISIFYYHYEDPDTVTTNLLELDSPSCTPWVSDDLIVFDRPVFTGTNGQYTQVSNQMMWARLSDPSPLPVIIDGFDNRSDVHGLHPWVASDLSEIYFVSEDNEGTQLTREIVRAERIDPSP